MYYGTHAIAPLVMASNSRIARTHCFGSGVMRDELQKQYNNPFPIECALFEFENGLKGEVTRSLFSTARSYTESFNIYGEKSTFEWQQIEGEDPILFTMGESTPDGKNDYFRGKPTNFRRFDPKNHSDLLPGEIAKYTIRGKYYDETNPQITFEEGGGHGGSHPHMVHEFVRSILENRKPWINEIVAANITAAGICAHESAMNNGKEVIIPEFANSKAIYSPGMYSVIDISSLSVRSSSMPTRTAAECFRFIHITVKSDMAASIGLSAISASL